MTAVILLSVLLIFAQKILFALESLLCMLIDTMYKCFEAFASITPVKYFGNQRYLINVFFENDVVSTVYWGMACIGFALMFGFAIVAVVKKLFDSTGEKVKATYGMILTNCFKSVLLILLMTAIVSATIDATGVLMRSVDYLFNHAEAMANPNTIVFTSSDFATMNRIFNTIGNYSLNPSYDNRFNINACFNDIEQDMQLLDKTGMFDYSYTNPQNGEDPNTTWQRILLNIYAAQDVYKPLPIDSYNESVVSSIKEAMYQVKVNNDFKPLQKYSETNTDDSLGTTIGRTIMLTASFGHAKNSRYDEHPSVTDGLRRAYYTGEKNIYDYDTVEKDFELGIFSWNHLVAIVVSFFVLKEMFVILLNSVARIFNIILLYITAPGFLAVIPLDDGGKLKQWTTAFVIQSLSLFGSVFAVRLLMIFLPIVMSSDLELFENNFANGVGKLVFMIGICVTSEKANGLISGILADNAGYQSIMAGDVGGGVMNKAMALGGKALSIAGKAGFKLADGAVGALGAATGATHLFKDTIGGALKNFGQSVRESKGGFVGAAKKGFKTNEQIKSKADEQKQAAQEQDTKDFRSSVLSSLQSMAGGGGGDNIQNHGDAGAQGDSQPQAQEPPGEE